jgi:hypothetical protein
MGSGSVIGRALLHPAAVASAAESASRAHNDPGAKSDAVIVCSRALMRVMSTTRVAHRAQCRPSAVGVIASHDASQGFGMVRRRIDTEA